MRTRNNIYSVWSITKTKLVNRALQNRKHNGANGNNFISCERHMEAYLNHQLAFLFAKIKENTKKENRKITSCHAFI